METSNLKNENATYFLDISILDLNRVMPKSIFEFEQWET